MLGQKINIKNFDELSDNILDIWSKFPVSLCEKLFNQFNDKINYVKDHFGIESIKIYLIKLKKGEKTNIKLISRKEPNKLIKKKK